MRQAIITKFHGPSNVRGSRVSATAEAGRIILHWDHSLNSDQNHIAAAQALATKLGWNGTWIGGVLPNADCVFTLIDLADTHDSFVVPKTKPVAA